MTEAGARLYAEIQAEEEIRTGASIGKAREGAQGPSAEKIQAALELIYEAGLKGRLAIAASGGTDSTVLLDLAGQAGAQGTVIHVKTGMDYPGTAEFVWGQAARVGLSCRMTGPAGDPRAFWEAHGWPMLGKMAARIWTQRHQGRGFTLNCAECCRTFKIGPARRLTKNIGARVQLTGTRGAGESILRRHRQHLDGAMAWNERDRIWVAAPMAGWTDEDVAGYIRARGLEEHPWRARGAETIGCIYCGGGAQFENSGYRLLRGGMPEAWWRFVVGWRGGEIILAVKYDARIDEIREAVTAAGGLERLSQDRPWVFDFLRRRPLKGRAM